MKTRIVILLLALAGFMNLRAQEVVQEYSAEDLALVADATTLLDGGLVDEAIEVLTKFDGIHQYKLIVKQELMRAYLVKGDYAKVIEIGTKVIEYKRCMPEIYSILGQAYANSGNTSQATKIFRAGVERYPTDGRSWMILGEQLQKDYKNKQALEAFEEGILREPGFVFNYIYAASNYKEEKDRLWRMLYAETSVLLYPSSSMNKNFAEVIYGTYESALTFESEGVLHISFVDGGDFDIDEKTAMMKVKFGNMFEVCHTNSLSEQEDGKINWCIDTLASVRQKALNCYFKGFDGCFGNRMELFNYQKRLADAGHWEAYHYWLFGKCEREEFGAWVREQENAKKLAAFNEWMYENPFVLDADHTMSQKILKDEEAKGSLEHILGSREEAIGYLESSAMRMAYAGRPDRAAVYLNKVDKCYPDNYDVRSTLALCHYYAGNADRALRILRDLFKHPDCDGFAYVIASHCYDALKRKDKVKETYIDGLRLYPESGELWRLSGEMKFEEGDNKEAIFDFERGIKNDPDYWMNYFDAAYLYYVTTEPLWTIIYGETYFVVQPNSFDNNKQLAAFMVAAFKRAMKVENGIFTMDFSTFDDTQSLLNSMNADANRENRKYKIPFEQVFEGCFTPSPEFMANPTEIEWSVKYLTDIRLKALNRYVDDYKSPFGNRMELFNVQKSIADAGHWEAYNYWIFGNVFIEEYGSWIASEENYKKLTEFLKWLADNPIKLDEDHTVSQYQLLE